MDVFLLEVEDVYALHHKKKVRRPLLAPPLRDDGPKIQKGDAIVLVRSDGSEIETTIWDLKHFNIKPYRGFWTVELPSELKVEHIPIGTQVWMRVINTHLMKIYCSTCKTEREAEDVQTIILENGRPAEEGICPVCGSKLLQVVFPNSCQ